MILDLRDKLKEGFSITELALKVGTNLEQYDGIRMTLEQETWYRGLLLGDLSIWQSRSIIFKGLPIDTRY